MNNTEISAIILRIENCNNAEPWFGRSIYALLGDIRPEKAFEQITISSENPGHSAADLLWHMITWAEFTLHRIQQIKMPDLAAAEADDWREIDPAVHTWKKGMATFKKLHQQIILELKKKDDHFLNEKVDYRKYNFRYLINGLIEHNIYHAGQIAYINKLF